ncbi:VOC family protein [Actinospica durhamensis]|uniref:VOC family protein n=1 Tax=Actinospica durhamensis TaxID=1508375 RepID=A0A941EX86_9ACTN|nr:VOC family protein [Actinospica durhamensis]MBR7838988.1 VOC family protein [Actinospica durhamensis]
MDVSVLFAAIAVADLEVGLAWYADLFGRAPDMPVNESESMWRCSDSAWLYVLRDAERAGSSIVTICVPDLDAVMAEFAGRGISRVPVEQVTASARKATYIDPDGNRVAVIEVRQDERAA